MDVYNFEVDSTHNYILANGIVVHNCDLISQLMMLETITPPISFEENDHDSKPLKRRSGMWAHHDLGDEEGDQGAYSTYM